MAEKLIAASPAADPERRRFLYRGAAALGAVGLAAAAWPLIDSLNPAADQRVPDYVDLEGFAAGERRIVLLRGLGPVFVSHRTPDEIAAAKADDEASLKHPEPDVERVRRDPWLVVVGLCTFRSCPLAGQGDDALYWQGWSAATGQSKLDRGRHGGWSCLCCGSLYDTSGRIRSGPAPRNLRVPDHRFTSDGLLEIAWW